MASDAKYDWLLGKQFENCEKITILSLNICSVSKFEESSYF